MMDKDTKLILKITLSMFLLMVLSYFCVAFLVWDVNFGCYERLDGTPNSYEECKIGD